MKKEWKYFTFFHHEKEEAYLREQHKKGWKFLRTTGIGTYHFAPCAPEDMIYQLDFYQGEPGNKEDYLRMFSDCGWEFLQEYAGYSYFRKPVAQMNGEETIFCDDGSRLAMMERVYKGRLLPLLIIFFTCLLPQFILNLANGRYGLAAFMGGLLGFYSVFFGYCAVQYYRKKTKATEN